MARKAREILLANGFTETDLADPAMVTMLGNPRWCAALEAEATKTDEAIAEQDRLLGVVQNTNNWFTTQAKPALDDASRRIMDAEGKAAQYKAQLDEAARQGLIKVNGDGGTGGAGGQGGSGGGSTTTQRSTTGGSSDLHRDPVTGQFVTPEQLDQRITDGLNRAGDIMQMSVDIPFDHRDLFGAPLPGGMGGLRQQYRDAVQKRHYQGSLQDFWEDTYKVRDKRAAVETERHQKELDDYAKQKLTEAKTQWESERANPMTRPFAPSRTPFTNRGTVIQGASSASSNAATGGGTGGTGGGSGTGGTGSGERKQPWEKTPEQRSQDRITNFVKKSMERGTAA